MTLRYYGNSLRFNNSNEPCKNIYSFQGFALKYVRVK